MNGEHRYFNFPPDFRPRTLPEAILFGLQVWHGEMSQFRGYMHGYLLGAQTELPEDIVWDTKALSKWARRMVEQDRCLRCDEKRLDHAADLSCYREPHEDEKFIDPWVDEEGTAVVTPALSRA